MNPTNLRLGGASYTLNPFEAFALTVAYDSKDAYSVIYEGQNMAADFNFETGSWTVRRAGTYRMSLQGTGSEVTSVL